MHWQTYAAGLLFLLLSMGPMVLIGLTMEKAGRAGGAVGCLSMLAMPFFQTFALIVFVLTLSPILLGLSNDAAWSFPWMLTAEAPWTMTKFVGKLLLVALVLAFIPLIGRIQSLHTLLLGGIALASVIEIIGTIYPVIAAKNVTLWPGFLFLVGLLVLSALMAWLGMMAVALLVTIVEARFEGIGQILVFPVAAVFGFIPLFIYGAWLGAQLRAG
ncbi:MAG: hypothetical protein ABL907_21910 [Hyphomicrobium sp.]